MQHTRWSHPTWRLFRRWSPAPGPHASLSWACEWKSRGTLSDCDTTFPCTD
jgi:hypothetical protein